MDFFSSRAGVFAVLALLVLGLAWMVLDSEPPSALNSPASTGESDSPELTSVAEAPSEIDPALVRSELEHLDHSTDDHATPSPSFSFGDLGKKLFGQNQARSIRISGQVLHKSQPVGGATVEVYLGQFFSSRNGKAVEKADQTIVCDGNGFFELSLKADSLRLIAKAEGYRALDLLEISSDAPAECLDLKLSLHAAASLSGKVVDANGQAVTGAEIEVELDGQWSRHRPGEIPGTSYRALDLSPWHSEIDGSFRGQVATGSYTLVGHHKVAGKSDYHMVEAGDSDIVLTLKPQPADLGSRVFGVVHRPDGRPAQEGQVVFSARGKIHKTNTEGEFSIAGAKEHWAIPPEVEAWAPGSAPIAIALDALEPEVGPLQIQLPQGHEISGVVLDQAGVPAVGKKLRLLGLPVYGDGSTDRKTILSLFPEGPRSERLDRQITDDQGQFSFVDLPVEQFTIVVEGQGRLPYASTVAYADTHDVVLREGELNAPSLTLFGQVVDGNTGAGMGGIKVTVNQVTRAGGGGGGWSASSIRDQRTDGSGQFRFEALDPAEYYLVAEGKGYAQVRQAPAVYEAGETRFELLIYPSRTVFLLVVDAAENPVPGASVRVQDPLGNSMMIQLGGGSARTPVNCDEEGKVIMHEMPGGLVKMLVGGNNGQSTYEEAVDLSQPGRHNTVLKLPYVIPGEYQQLRLVINGVDEPELDLGPLAFSALDSDGLLVSHGILSRENGVWQWDSGSRHTEGLKLNATLSGAGAGGQILMTGPGWEDQRQSYALKSDQSFQSIAFEL
jgi:carboxypeptidase family protein